MFANDFQPSIRLEDGLQEQKGSNGSPPNQVIALCGERFRLWSNYLCTASGKHFMTDCFNYYDICFNKFKILYACVE